MALLRKLRSPAFFRNRGFTAHFSHPFAPCPGGKRLLSSAGSLDPEAVSYLRDAKSGREVYLVGTAHVSSQSAKDVLEVIEHVQPDSIMLELCAERARRLRGDDGDEEDNTSAMELARQLLKQMLHGKAAPGFGTEALLKFGLSGFYSMLKQSGLLPGQEFRVALQEADKRDLPVCLGDQDIDKTVSDLKTALGQVSLTRILAPPPMPKELQSIMDGMDVWNIEESVEKLKNRRQIAAFRDYAADVAPEVMERLVHKRDVFMANQLLRNCKGERVVAVVGMAHMDGIEQEWQDQGGEIFLHSTCSMRS